MIKPNIWMMDVENDGSKIIENVWSVPKAMRRKRLTMASNFEFL